MQRVESDLVVGDYVIVDCRSHLLAGFQILNADIGHRLYHVGHQDEKQFQSHYQPGRSTIALASSSKCE